MSLLLGEGLDHFQPQGISGPYAMKGTYPLRVAAGSSVILGRPLIRTFLCSVTIDAADPSTTVNIYEGTNSSGTLVASIACSKRRTIPFNFSLYQGCFVSVVGGAGSCVVVSDSVGPNSGSLTVSGNEITDATRLAATAWATGQQGGSTDGLAYTGVRNLLANGGLESNSTGWIGNNAGSTISRDTTQAKFGVASLKCVCAGTNANEGVLYKSADGVHGTSVDGGAVYTASIWVRVAALGGANLTARIQQNDSANVFITNINGSSVTGVTTGWVQLTVSGTLASNCTQVFVVVTTGGTYSATFWVDGAQLEIGGNAHTYVETNGAAATSASGSPDSSFGIWEAATNHFRRGQCDATTDYTLSGGGTTVQTVDATVPAPFSTQSVKFAADGLAATQGGYCVSATGLAAVAGTVGCGSIWFKGVSGASYKVQIVWNNADASQTVGTVTTFSATGDWQLLTPASVAVAVGKTGNQLAINFNINGTRAESFWVAHAQLESGTGIVSPYIATSGGATATRAVSLVEIPRPSAAFSATGFWIAGRFRVRWTDAMSVTVAHNLRFFEIFIDANNKINVVYARGSTTISAGVNIAGVNVSATAAYTPSIGDTITLCAYFGDRHAVSVNGAAFTRSAAGQSLPVWTDAARAGIASTQNGGGPICLQGECLWFATGPGILSDADAATINGFGSTDHLPSDFPGNCTIVWPADSSRYYTP